MDILKHIKMIKLNYRDSMSYLNITESAQFAFLTIMQMVMKIRASSSEYNYEMWGQLWRRGAKCERELVVGSHPTRGNEVFNILISSFWYRDKTWRWVPPLNTQFLQNSLESGKLCVLALGFLYLPRHMRYSVKLE